jgi:hypothetical protein
MTDLTWLPYREAAMNRLVVILAVSLASAACARLDFGSEGLTYYDPKPYLFVATNKDCVSTATVVAVPDKKRSLHFKTGYGSADLSAGLAGGLLTSVGQKTDTKIPETIGALADLKTAIVPLATGKAVICTPSARLYPIESGTPNLNASLEFPISTQTIDKEPEKR